MPPRKRKTRTPKPKTLPQVEYLISEYGTSTWNEDEHKYEDVVVLGLVVSSKLAYTKRSLTKIFNANHLDKTCGWMTLRALNKNNMYMFETEDLDALTAAFTPELSRTDAQVIVRFRSMSGGGWLVLRKDGQWHNDPKPDPVEIEDDSSDIQDLDTDEEGAA